MNSQKLTVISASALGLVLLVAAGADAADVIKTNNTDALNLGTSWVGGTAPTPGDVAVWDSTVTGPNTSALGDNVGWQGIRVANPGGAAVISPSATQWLTNGAAGINMSAATTNFTANSRIFIGATQPWSVAAGRVLRFSSNARDVLFGGAGDITVSGGGFIVPNGSGSGTAFAGAFGLNDFTGNWFINGGTVCNIWHGQVAWGQGVIHLGGGTIGDGVPTAIMSGSLGNWVWTNNIVLDAGTSSAIDNFNTGSGRFLLLGGVISGSGNLTFMNSSNSMTAADTGFILSGENTMSGVVIIAPVARLRVGGKSGLAVSDSSVQNVNAGIIGGTLGTAIITNHGNLTFMRTDAHIVANAIHGTGNLRIGGALAGAEGQFVTLTAANTYTGNTFVNMGTLALGPGGSIANSANIILNPISGGYVNFNVSATPGYTLNSGQKLIGQSAAGAGSVSGNVTAAGGSFLVPGGSNSVNLLTFDNDLALSGSGTIIMDLNTASWDKIGVTGNLNPAGVTTIQIVNAGGLANGDYPLIEVSGTLGGSAANFTASGLVSSGTRQSFSIAYDKSVIPNVVKLVVGGSPAGDLTWTGDGTANVWDVSGALNWLNLGVLDKFFNNDLVTFTDSGSKTPAVNLTGTLLPAAVNVSSADNYTFLGTGKISGSTSLTNSGAGTLSILNTNDFTGRTVITTGAIAITNEAALGAAQATLAADQLILDGGAINVNATLAWSTNRGITVGSAGGALSTPGAVTLAMNAPFAGDGALLKTGSGSLELSNSSPAYMGYLTVAGGSAKLGTPYGAGGSGIFGGRIAIQSGTFDINGMTDYANNGQIEERTWLVANGTYVKFGGGAASATSTLVDSGTNGFGTYLAGIQYDATGDPGMATVAALWKQNGQSITAVNNVEVGDSANTAVELDFTGGMSQKHLLEGKQTTIEKTGPGTMRISCPNYFPGLRITDGTVLVNHLQALGAQHNWTNFLNDPNVVTVNGGTLDLNGFSNQISGLAGTGGTVLNNGGAASVFNVGIDDTNTVNTDYAGIIQNGSSAISLTKRGAGTLTLSGANTYNGATLVSSGTLIVNGSLASPVTADGGSIGGSGTINSTVTVLAAGGISPGSSVGTLTVSGAINSSGTAFMEIDRTNTPAISDRLVGLSGVTLGGSLVVTNVGEALQAGDAFQLFSGAPLNVSFNSITLPGLGSGLAWSNALALNGSIAVVVSTVNTTATNITAKVSGSNLEVSWPADHTGWQLQVQTNAISVGLSSNWVPWTGSVTTNQVFVPIIPENHSVFLRLVYPPQ